MAFSIKYKKLFEVEFRQNYYLDKGPEEFASLPPEEQQQMLETYRKTYNLLDDFFLFPTPETQRTLARLGMLMRTTSTGFFVAAEVEEPSPGTFILKHLPESPLRLRFALGLKASFFMNYTNLSLYDYQQKVYYFSNLPAQRGTTRTFPFLSLIPPSFQSGTAYKAGDLIRRTIPSFDVYMARRAGSHSRPPDRASNDNWKFLEGQGYVNLNDRVSLYPPLFTFAFPPDTVVEASFKVVAPDGEEVDAGEAEAPNGETLKDYPLDLRALEAGQYRLEVEGFDTQNNSYSHIEEIYLDSVLPAKQIFGLVEVFHLDGNALGDYGLLDANNQLLQPLYVIHFLNRYTFWRYVFNTVPDPLPDLGDFDQIDELHYVTKASLSLTRSFTPILYDTDVLLPNPIINTIKPEDDRVYSDVYIHN